MNKMMLLMLAVLLIASGQVIANHQKGHYPGKPKFAGQEAACVVRKGSAYIRVMPNAQGVVKKKHQGAPHIISIWPGHGQKTVRFDAGISKCLRPGGGY